MVIITANKTFSCRIYVPGLLLTQTLTYIAATWLLCIRVLVLYPSIKWLKFLVYGCLITTHLAINSIGIYAFVGDVEGYFYGSYARKYA